MEFLVAEEAMGQRAKLAIAVRLDGVLHEAIVHQARDQPRALWRGLLVERAIGVATRLLMPSLGARQTRAPRQIRVSPSKRGEERRPPLADCPPHCPLAFDGAQDREDAGAEGFDSPGGTHRISRAARGGGGEAPVVLLVGGMRFETSAQSLTRFEDSMLGAMFGRHAGLLRADADGSVSLHGRDGTHFHVVLNFLQTGDAVALREALRILPDAETARLVCDLDYYGLTAHVFEALDYADFRPGPNVAGRGPTAVALAHTHWALLVGGRAARETVWLDTRTLQTRPGPRMLRSRDGGASLHWPHGREDGSAHGPKGGCIFVFGGRESGASTATTEVLDFEARRWAAGPSLPRPRQDFAAVVVDHPVADGSLRRRILVIGGYDSTAPSRDRTLATTAWLDVDTLSWSPGPPLPEPRRGHVAVVLRRHGCVLVAGGSDGKSDTKATWIFDVGAEDWRRGPDLAEPRSGAAAITLAGGDVLVVGGRAGGKRTASTELLRAETMRFEPGPTLARPRNGAVVLPVGSAGGGARARALVVGGDGRRTSWGADALSYWADDDARAQCATTTELLTVRRPHRDGEDTLLYNLRARAADDADASWKGAAAVSWLAKRLRRQRKQARPETDTDHARSL
ncbi:hypothetical protein M885DRAFT_610968 [Pelagophyceae sp. CCMP2097]|nr:hypothetical protein M885DRAFT_610968 [Pelagophyceae sp. CCMP2097]